MHLDLLSIPQSGGKNVYCFWFCLGVPTWRLINVSVQYNGGLLPDIISVDPM